MRGGIRKKMGGLKKVYINGWVKKSVHKWVGNFWVYIHIYIDIYTYIWVRKNG